MQNQLSYIITDDGLTAIINGTQYTITRDNPSYTQVKNAIIDREDVEDIEVLFQQATAIRKYFAAAGEDTVSVQDGVIFYQGEAVHNVVTDRILNFMSEGLPVEPLVNFLKRLLANPSKRATEELYTFLEHKNFPITPEGFILVYKGVTEDYKDCHTRTFDNFPGAINEMPRPKVDDDARRACSAGFHVGTLEYATGFGSRTVIVQVDPADVVSIPYDSGCQKMRTCKYEVLSDYYGSMGNTLRDSAAPYGSDFVPQSADTDDNWGF